MPIHNVMEEVVYDVLQEHLRNLTLSCTCEQCIDDIMAITLNQLPSRYIAKKEFTPYVRAEHLANRQGLTNIVMEIAKSAKTVSANPRCSLSNDKK